MTLAIVAAMVCGSCAQFEPRPGDRFNPTRLANGVYELYFHQGCDTPYNGEYRADSVYVVAFGEPDERIFRKSSRQDAVRYAQQLGGGYKAKSFGTTQLCEAAMLAVFGK